MNSYLTTRFGYDIKNPSETQISQALAELDVDDDEHPDVAFRNEEEWSLAIFPSGKVIFENLEDGEPKHMKGVSRDQVKEFWRHIAFGDLTALRALPWLSGYGND